MAALIVAQALGDSNEEPGPAREDIFPARIHVQSFTSLSKSVDNPATITHKGLTPSVILLMESVMMRKNRLQDVCSGLLLCSVAAGCITLLACGCGPSEFDRSLPVYTMDQTDSSHPGYRRSTLTSGSTVYENDYAENALQLVNVSPTQIVGRIGGGGEKTYVYAVIGQDPKDYIVPVGEMYPGGVYRNTKLAPFDWRSARFQKIEFALATGPAAHQTSTNSVLIDEVLAVLKDAKVSTPPSYVPGSFTNVTAIFLYNDQLPGLKFAPGVYMDPTGPYYLGDNQSSKTWFRAGPLFSAWVQTPSSR